MRNKLLGIFFISISLSCFGQKSEKLPRFFADPIVVDSSSTVIIPTRYNSDFLTSSKIGLWNDYYANIIFYDFSTDSTRKLFPGDTYIKGFTDISHYRYVMTNKSENIFRNWIFYFVKPTDFDSNGRVDNSDPSILFVSDKHGNGLKSVTPDNENAVSIDVFEDQGFALVKMQRDFDKDNDFESNDKDYYYIRLDLATMTLGRKIEL